MPDDFCEETLWGATVSGDDDWSGSLIVDLLISMAGEGGIVMVTRERCEMPNSVEEKLIEDNWTDVRFPIHSVDKLSVDLGEELFAGTLWRATVSDHSDVVVVDLFIAVVGVGYIVVTGERCKCFTSDEDKLCEAKWTDIDVPVPGVDERSIDLDSENIVGSRKVEFTNTVGKLEIVEVTPSNVICNGTDALIFESTGVAKLTIDTLVGLEFSFAYAVDLSLVLAEEIRVWLGSLVVLRKVIFVATALILGIDGKIEVDVSSLRCAVGKDAFSKLGVLWMPVVDKLTNIADWVDTMSSIKDVFLIKLERFVHVGEDVTDEAMDRGCRVRSRDETSNTDAVAVILFEFVAKRLEASWCE